MEINIYTSNHNFKTTFTIKEKHGYENTLSILSTILTLTPISLEHTNSAPPRHSLLAQSLSLPLTQVLHTGPPKRFPNIIYGK